MGRPDLLRRLRGFEMERVDTGRIPWARLAPTRVEESAGQWPGRI